MKVLLLPNPVLEAGRPKSYVPLGVLSLATVLRDDGIDVEILDVNAVCSDATYREIPEAVVARRPDVVGFSTWCNYYLDLTKCARIVRELAPHTKILFGGVQATHTDRETVQAFPQVHVVARGECDHTIGDIVRSIHDPDKLRKVPGVTFMHRGNIIRTPDQGPVPDLDRLPLPDYSLIPSLDKIERIGVDVGRGCPFRCGYCVTNSMGGGRFRQRSVESVIKLIKSLVEDYGKDYLRIEHDLLTLNRTWLMTFCNALIAEHMNIRWECFSRIDTIDDEMVDCMARAGCNFIYFGIETGSPRMQKLLNKRLNLERAPAVVRKVCDAGIIAGSGFIIGFPQEESADLAQTMRLMLEVYFSGERGISDILTWLLVPFPGSPLFEKYGNRLALDEHLSNFSVSPATLVDTEFAKRYPQVFSTLYHYVPEHVDRDHFVRVAHLMMNLVSLRYTAFVLLKDPELGYPESLLDRIEDLDLPEGNIFNHIATSHSLMSVSQFIARRVNLLGHSSHYIHELMRFDLAFNRPKLSGEGAESTYVESFSFDVTAFIKEVRADGYRHLPRDIIYEPCAVLFRKRPDGAVDYMKLPAVFGSHGSSLHFGRRLTG
ncbi:MAG: radical SAM protein [Desulfomonilaceae bacterium]|nr:radical SAM protein [Desulfomonilaceae bacterium]